MTGGYISGSSWLHRLPPGLKIAALVAITTITFYLQSLLLTAAVFLAVCVVYLSIGSTPWRRRSSFSSLWFIFILIAIIQVLTSGPFIALLTLSQMITVLLCADLVSGTTSPLSMVDAFVQFLRPLEKLGFPLVPVSVALMLVLRFLPAQLNDWTRRHEAWRARGGNRGSWALIPLWMADVVKYSDRVAEALDARGFNDSGTQRHEKS